MTLTESNNPTLNSRSQQQISRERVGRNSIKTLTEHPNNRSDLDLKSAYTLGRHVVSRTALQFDQQFPRTRFKVVQRSKRIRKALPQLMKSKSHK